MFRNFAFCKENGYSGFMTPNVWMFIKSYEELRLFIIGQKNITSLVQMAKGAFFKEATVDICAFILANKHNNENGLYIRLENFKGGMEVQKQKVLEALADKNCGYFYEADQSNFSKIPGSPVAYWVSEAFYRIFEKDKISDYCETREGLSPADNERFLRLWAEVSTNKWNKKWFPYTKGGNFRKWYGNNEYMVNWENDGFEIRNNIDPNTGRIRSHNYNGEYAFKEGFTWTAISSQQSSFRYVKGGFLFDSAGSMGFAWQSSNLKYLIGVLNCKITKEAFQFISPTIKYMPGQVADIPCLLDRTKQHLIDRLVDESIELSKQDWDSYETSWDFKRNQLV